MKHDDWPHWGGEARTKRKWKESKRLRLRFALRTLENARRGVAYTPFYEDFKVAVAALEKCIRKASQKEWGR